MWGLLLKIKEKRVLLHDQRHSKVPAYDRCTAFNQQVCFRTFGDRWRSQLQLMPMMLPILGCKIWSITGFRQASRIRDRCRLQVKKTFQLMLMMRAQCLGSTCRLASEPPGIRIRLDSDDVHGPADVLSSTAFVDGRLLCGSVGDPCYGC